MGIIATGDVPNADKKDTVEQVDAEDTRRRDRASERRQRRSQQRQAREQEVEKENENEDKHKEHNMSESGICRAISSVYSRGRSSERCALFMKRYQEFREARKGEQRLELTDRYIRLIDLDSVQSSAVSFLAMIGNFNQEDDCYYYVLCLIENKENTIYEHNRKNDRRERRSGRAQEDVREYYSIMDRISDSTLTRLTESITDIAPAMTGKLVYAGAVVLNYNVNLESVESINPMLGTATDYLLVAAGITEALFDSDFKNESIKLEGIIGIAGTTDVVGYAGIPIRNDISISLETFSTSNNRSIDLLDDQGQKQWATGSAFIDMIPVSSTYSEDDEDEDYRDSRRGRRRGRTSSVACMTPRVIFSEIDPYRDDEDRSPHLRSLITTAIAIELGKDCRYMRTFMSSAFNGKDRDVRDFGYLMDPDGQVAPDVLVMENPEDDQEIFDTMDKLVRHDRGMEICVRYCEGQPGSGFPELLKAVYDDEEGAYDYVCDMLDDATAGRFSRELDKLRGSELVAGAITLPDGYFVTSQGHQPITKIDHWYAASKLMNKDVDRLDQFIDVHSFFSDMDYDERVTKAHELYSHLTTGNFKMTGMATLFALDPIALKAMYKAFSEASMELRVNRDRDEIRSRRGSRSGGGYGINFDDVRTNDRRGDRRDNDRRGERRARRTSW